MSYDDCYDDYSGDYTGDTGWVRMVWNIEGSLTWEKMRRALFALADCEDVVGCMIDGEFPLFRVIDRTGGVGAGGSGTWEQFIRSWADAEGVVMSSLHLDFALLEERLNVARTMLLVEHGLQR